MSCQSPKSLCIWKQGNMIPLSKKWTVWCIWASIYSLIHSSNLQIAIDSLLCVREYNAQWYRDGQTDKALLLWSLHLLWGVCYCCSVPNSFAISWMVALQAPLSVRFPRQEYGLPLPSPGYLPNPGIKSVSPAWQVGSLSLSPLCNTAKNKSPNTLISYCK